MSTFDFGLAKQINNQNFILVNSQLSIEFYSIRKFLIKNLKNLMKTEINSIFITHIRKMKQRHGNYSVYFLTHTDPRTFQVHPYSWFAE